MSGKSREPDGAGTWHGEFRRTLLRAPDPAPAGADGLELRPSTGVPATVWENVSHEQMTTEISTNANPAAVAESAREWLRIGDELQLHERALTRAIEDSRSDWQGAGGDAVRRHLTAVAHWLATTARGALQTGRQQQLHAQALEEARRRMAADPPVEFSPEAANARLQGTTDPVEYARRLAEDTRTRQAQEAAHAEAVRIMTEFDRALAQSVVTPFFAAPPELPGSAVRSGQKVAAVTPGLVPAAAGGSGPVSPVSRPELLVASGAGGVPLPDAAAVGAVGGVVPVSRSDSRVGGVPPVPDSTVAEGVGLFTRSDTGTGGIPPLPQAGPAVDRGVPPLPDSTVAGGAGPFSRPDPVATGVPPVLQPDSTVAERARPFSRSDSGAGGIPPLPQQGSGMDRGVPPLPDSTLPDSPLPEGPSPLRQPDGGIGGRIPPFPHSDSTAASGARWVPPIPPPDPALAAAVPPEPTAVSGTGGPGRVPPIPPVGPTISGAGPGRVPPLLPGGAASGGRGAGRRDDALRSGGPRAPELSGAVPDSAPAGIPAVPGPAGTPAGPQGAQASPTGVPRAGGKPPDDLEHRVADYLEADPDLFAAEQPVVPPTLGDWKKNKDWRKKP
ncbi:PPE domain-containing protein [Amycolatopsis sp. NPDC026612]|uniref:WXG100 family type VII secretion target n=1 Tax=Amycolatopsis sp. NPDC026612 TaxID=3155466 RepID=UPI0033C2BB02